MKNKLVVLLGLLLTFNSFAVPHHGGEFHWGKQPPPPPVPPPHHPGGPNFPAPAHPAPPVPQPKLKPEPEKPHPLTPQEQGEFNGNVRDLTFTSQKIMNSFNKPGVQYQLRSNFLQVDPVNPPKHERVNFDWNDPNDYKNSRSIPDIYVHPELKVGDYNFKPEIVAHLNELNTIAKQINKEDPTSNRSKFGKYLAGLTLNESRFAFNQGLLFEGGYYKQLTKDLMPFIIGMIPYTAIGIAAYETVSGLSFATGEQLSHSRRAFSMALVMVGPMRYIGACGRTVGAWIRSTSVAFQRSENIDQMIADAEAIAPNMYNPLKPGPLDRVPASSNPVIGLYGENSVTSTFRSGTYTQEVTTAPKTFYRVQPYAHNPKYPPGRYYISHKPTSGTQEIINSALKANWGNNGKYMMEIKVPAGTTYYRGLAGPQQPMTGGGEQIFIETVLPEWVTNLGEQL